MPPLTLHWFLPTNGDGRQLVGGGHGVGAGSAGAMRPASLPYLTQVAFRPGSISPTPAAQQAATYQRHSGGRLLLNVVISPAAVVARPRGIGRRPAWTRGDRW
ncbi:hypothetical protein GCM10010472_21010 [Pseudonocardia halophobica]|uniref:Uncharacterized protein n=1 Tax=Pseudonocardia halophobica TaxID=29401 RepID=A0A9W6L7Z9_9PSEU|nr:hypothetical protein GCM10017577_60820 [Pseudonocardia halophobica]